MNGVGTSDEFQLSSEMNVVANEDSRDAWKWST